MRVEHRVPVSLMLISIYFCADSCSQALYGPEYFMPPVPKMTPADLNRLEAIGRAFTRGASASVAVIASERIKAAYTKSVIFEKLLGERILRLRSLIAAYDKSSNVFPPSCYPREPVHATELATASQAADKKKSKAAKPSTTTAADPGSHIVSNSTVCVLVSALASQSPDPCVFFSFT